MKITGELLKSERAKQGLTVQDVAFSLKLSSKIINSIEAGELEELPAKTFVRGFVKSYAQHLKIDVDQVMRQFQEEMGSTHPLPKTPPPLSSSSHLNAEAHTTSSSAPTKKTAPQPAPSLHNDHSHKTLLYIGVAAILVILIISINKVVDKYQKDAVLDLSNATQIKAIESQSENIILADPISKSSVPATTAATSSDETTANTKPTAIAASLETSSNLSLSPEEGFETSSGKPVEVIIEAKKNVELLYAKGTSKSFSRIILQPKQIQVIRSSDGLYLKADDGGALHLIVNGVEKGTAGNSNKPIKLTF